MNPRDYLWLAGLLVSAVFIWMRDLAWVPVASETLPIVGALPLFVWLGVPWRIAPGEFRVHGKSLAWAAGLLVVGFAADLTSLLAAAWTLALWSWLRERVIGDIGRIRRLVLLPLLAFPWMTLDMAPVGWWFRVSAAWVAEQVFSGLGFAATRQGTALLVHGLPIEVAPACSGMNSLQALLIAGIILALHELRGNRWFALSLMTLPVLAWVANVLRVCSTVAIALTWGSHFAGGWVHEAGGWLAVMLVFVGWWWAIRAGARSSHTRQVCA